MLPPQTLKGFSFLGWLEEIFDIVPGIPKQTWAIVQKPYGEIFLMRLKAYPSLTPSDSSQDYIAALYAGDVADLKGYVAQLDLLGKNGLLTNPTTALHALGKQTVKDILSLDEIASDRRTEIAIRLLRGQVTDGNDPAPKNK